MEANRIPHDFVVPRKQLKASLDLRENPINHVEPDCEAFGNLVVVAWDKVGMQQKEAAIVMGLSDPQLTRQRQGLEHLSAQRLWKLSDAFWLALVVAIIRARKLGTVRSQVRIDLDEEVA